MQVSLLVLLNDVNTIYIFHTFKITTVKLGYNELGYSELPVITNKFCPFFRSQIHVHYIN